jgi:hypothetical protein
MTLKPSNDGNLGTRESDRELDKRTISARHQKPHGLLVPKPPVLILPPGVRGGPRTGGALPAGASLPPETGAATETPKEGQSEGPSPEARRKGLAVVAIHAALEGMDTPSRLSVLMVAAALVAGELIQAGVPRGKLINSASNDFRAILQKHVPNTADQRGLRR